MNTIKSTGGLRDVLQTVHDYLSDAGVLDHPAFGELGQAIRNTGLVNGGTRMDGNVAVPVVNKEPNIELNPWTLDPYVFMKGNSQIGQSQRGSNAGLTDVNQSETMEKWKGLNQAVSSITGSTSPSSQLAGTYKDSTGFTRKIYNNGNNRSTSYIDPQGKPSNFKAWSTAQYNLAKGQPVDSPAIAFMKAIPAATTNVIGVLAKGAASTIQAGTNNAGGYVGANLGEGEAILNNDWPGMLAARREQAQYGHNLYTLADIMTPGTFKDFATSAGQISGGQSVQGAQTLTQIPKNYLHEAITNPQGFALNLGATAMPFGQGCIAKAANLERFAVGLRAQGQMEKAAQIAQQAQSWRIVGNAATLKTLKNGADAVLTKAISKAPVGRQLVTNIQNGASVSQNIFDRPAATQQLSNSLKGQFKKFSEVIDSNKSKIPISLKRKAILGSGGGQLPNSSNGNQTLVHLTNPTGKINIEASSKIGGKYGIFALPKDRVPETNLGRNASTLVPGDLSQTIEIPKEANHYFHRPPVIGPVSAYRRYMGIQSTPLGSIDLNTGNFTPNEILDKGTFRTATPINKFKYYGHEALLNYVPDSIIGVGGVAGILGLRSKLGSDGRIQNADKAITNVPKSKVKRH